MSLLLRIALAVFSCYRLAQLIALDDGPFYIFRDLRLTLGKFAARNEAREKRWRHSLAELVTCPFCMGIWFAVPLTVMVLLPNGVFDAILIFLTIAGAQTFLQEQSRDNER